MTMLLNHKKLHSCSG